jgi:hypothetical protein
MPPREEELQQILRFWPWPPGDTFSQYVLNQLDKVTLINVQTVELQRQHAILTANLHANQQLQEILKSVKR